MTDKEKIPKLLLREMLELFGEDKTEKIDKKYMKIVKNIPYNKLK